MGKLTFGKIRDHSGDIQMCFMRDKVIFNTGKPSPQTSPSSGMTMSLPLKGEGIKSETEYIKVTELEIAGEPKTAYKIAEKFCQVGDYIGITGDLFLTKH